MKCLFWKCCILVMLLSALLVLGAFAEGSIGLPLACALVLLTAGLIRRAWAMEQRAERQAERRAAARRQVRAAVPPQTVPQPGPDSRPSPKAGGPLRVA